MDDLARSGRNLALFWYSELRLSRFTLRIPLNTSAPTHLETRCKRTCCSPRWSAGSCGFRFACNRLPVPSSSPPVLFDRHEPLFVAQGMWYIVLDANRRPPFRMLTPGQGCCWTLSLGLATLSRFSCCPSPLLFSSSSCLPRWLFGSISAAARHYPFRAGNALASSLRSPCIAGSALQSSGLVRPAFTPHSTRRRWGSRSSGSPERFAAAMETRE